MEYHPRKQFIDAPSLFAASRDAGQDGFTPKVDATSNKRVTIDTGIMRVVFTEQGKPFCSDNLNVFFELDGEQKFWDPKAKTLQNLGGTIPSLDGQRGPTRLGDGLLSRDGWYMIDDSDTHLMVDGWVQRRPEDAGQDWYLFIYGRDFQAALDALSRVSGDIPLPRKYTLGSWYSRWHAYTSEEYRAVVDEYDRHNYPLDIMVWDMDWHRKEDAESGWGWANTLGWTGFSWNRELLPDAEELIGELKDRGIAVTLNVHPHDGIREHEDMYADFMRDLGKNPETDPTPPFDAGDKQYMDAYFRHGHQPHENAGVEFWWVDWQQDVIMPEARSVPGLRHLPWLNELYFRHSRRNNKRGLSFSRFAGWGDHRHPINFSGDAITGWEMLAFQVPFTTASANVGCFFWSHDMGGFMGDIDDEIYARWLQFGAFTAAMRLHGLGADRRPWKWADWAEPSMHQSFELRSRLIPYTYSSVARSCRKTVPLCRAMYIDHPEDERAYRNPQQYMYGDHLLVAPIASPGQGPGCVATQTACFPDGHWYNWFTGEMFEGPRETLVCADLYEMPLYVRAGTPIPMQPFELRMTNAPLAELVVRCYPGRDNTTGNFTLYEDDGISRNYEQGQFAETEMKYTRCGNQITVKIEGTRGDYAELVHERGYRIELPCTEPAANVRVNDQNFKSEYNEETQTNTVTIPKQSVRAPVEVTMEAADADQNAIRRNAIRRRAAGLVGKKELGTSIAALISAAAKREDHPLASALASLLGLGLHRKDESVTGDRTLESTKLYAPSGLLDDNKVRLTVTKRSDSDTPQHLLNAEYRDLSDTPIPVPDFPNHKRDSLTCRIDCTIDGHPVSIPQR